MEKAQIQDLLTDTNTDCEDNINKKFFKIVRFNSSHFKKHVVDTNIFVLRSPIELIWAQLKGMIARENKTFKLWYVKNANNKLNYFTKLEKCIKNVKKGEE